jgi:hypothetical protein
VSRHSMSRFPMNDTFNHIPDNCHIVVILHLPLLLACKPGVQPQRGSPSSAMDPSRPTPGVSCFTQTLPGVLSLPYARMQPPMPAGRFRGVLVVLMTFVHTEPLPFDHGASKFRSKVQVTWVQTWVFGSKMRSMASRHH